MQNRESDEVESISLKGGVEKEKKKKKKREIQTVRGLSEGRRGILVVEEGKRKGKCVQRARPRRMLQK